LWQCELLWFHNWEAVGIFAHISVAIFTRGGQIVTIAFSSLPRVASLNLALTSLLLVREKSMIAHYWSIMANMLGLKAILHLYRLWLISPLL